MQHWTAVRRRKWLPTLQGTYTTHTVYRYLPHVFRQLPLNHPAMQVLQVCCVLYCSCSLGTSSCVHEGTNVRLLEIRGSDSGSVDNSCVLGCDAVSLVLGPMNSWRWWYCVLLKRQEPPTFRHIPGDTNSQEQVKLG